MVDGSISVESVLVKVEGDEDDQKSVFVSWTNQDEDLGSYILGFLQTMLCWFSENLLIENLSYCDIQFYCKLYVIPSWNDKCVF